MSQDQNQNQTHDNLSTCSDEDYQKIMKQQELLLENTMHDIKKKNPLLLRKKNSNFDSGEYYMNLQKEKLKQEALQKLNEQKNLENQLQVENLEKMHQVQMKLHKPKTCKQVFDSGDYFMDLWQKEKKKK